MTKQPTERHLYRTSINVITHRHLSRSKYHAYNSCSLKSNSELYHYRNKVLVRWKITRLLDKSQKQNTILTYHCFNTELWTSTPTAGVPRGWTLQLPTNFFTNNYRYSLIFSIRLTLQYVQVNRQVKSNNPKRLHWKPINWYHSTVLYLNTISSIASLRKIRLCVL